MIKASERILRILDLLDKKTKDMTPPASFLIKERFGNDPFFVLVGCILSLRTKDTVSFLAACRLFSHAKTVYELKNLSIDTIQKDIYPVGFYRVKSLNLIKIAYFNNLIS